MFEPTSLPSSDVGTATGKRPGANSDLRRSARLSAAPTSDGGDVEGGASNSVARYAIRRGAGVSAGRRHSAERTADSASVEEVAEVAPPKKKKRTASRDDSPAAVSLAASTSPSKAPLRSPSKPKPIKKSLETPYPAPKNWEKVYALIEDQRRRIVAPVDTMGCDQSREKGMDERHQRYQILISLMLSSQTKDPVTTEAVRNLQRTLPGGLTLENVLEAEEKTIEEAICKVGFWRRKTQYIKSASILLRDRFSSDVPQTVDELCSLPGVGPKMAFLALQSAWGINEGIGVDTHVHRITNRLGWHGRKGTTEPEATRLNLESWLPKELHRTVNKMLVGFGQVICTPAAPRCDLCSVAAANLCPSRRRVDPKSIKTRVKLEVMHDGGEGEGAGGEEGEGKPKVEAVLEEVEVGTGVDGAKEEKVVGRTGLGEVKGDVDEIGGLGLREDGAAAAAAAAGVKKEEERTLEW